MKTRSSKCFNNLFIFQFSLKTAPSKVNDETYTEVQERQAELDSDGEELDEGDEAELPDHLKNDEKVS